MSRLLENNKEFRDKLIVKNTYNNNNSYSESHKNALSDGDDKGKGAVGDSIGSQTDINKRNELMVKNMYSNNKEYGQAGTV